MTHKWDLIVRIPSRLLRKAVVVTFSLACPSPKIALQQLIRASRVRARRVTFTMNGIYRPLDSQADNAK